MTKLIILGLEVSTPEPYAAGHVCTLAEAAALNAALTRGLAKGIHRRLRERYDAEGRETPSEADRAEIAKFFPDFLRGFAEGHERLRVIEAESRRIARGHIEAQLYRHGRKLSELAKGEQEELIAREAATAAVLAEATRRIDTLRSIGSAALEDLLGEET
jgi:hypothetical protein